jgi:hypothetical protein
LYPSGSEVKYVGLAAKSAAGVLKKVQLEKRPNLTTSNIISAGEGSDEGGEIVEIKGVLNFAKSTSRTRRISIDVGVESIEIDVPDGMMADVVRPHFDLRVVVKALRRSNGKYMLEQIESEK